MNARTIWKLIPVIVVCSAVGIASAKLPAPQVDPAKAAADKEKAAAATKKSAELLGKAQDRVAEHYKKQKPVATAKK